MAVGILCQYLGKGMKMQCSQHKAGHVVTLWRLLLKNCNQLLIAAAVLAAGLFWNVESKPQEHFLRKKDLKR